MIKKNFISIVTATYFSEKSIAKTIESVLNQTNSNFEYIVIDGASKDKTLSIVKSYQAKFQKKKITLTIISEADTSIYNAFNKGIKLAKGNWITFLGSDDILMPETLENYYNLNLSSDTDFVYSNVNLIDKNGKVVKKINEKWSWNTFKRYMNIPHVGSLHNSNYFNIYGYFDENYKIAGDYELLLRAKENLKTYKLNKLTVLMLTEGVSNNSIFKVLKETKKAKIATAKTSKFISTFDYYLALLKFIFRKLKNEVI